MKNNNPLVSIGLPSYNRPITLERTLHSLINQTYTNLEIIVSDNCSTNPEVELVINKFRSDSRIKYYRQSINKGAAFNFNYLLEKVTGSFFMRLGDDDWLDSNFIEACLTFLLNNSDYVGVYGRTKLYDLNNSFLKFDPNLIGMDKELYFDRMIYYYQNVTQNGPYFGLIRTEFINSAFGKNRLAEDWLGVARFAFSGKFKMLENTHLNLSLGGVGGSIDGIVKSLGLSKFNKYFPYCSISINAFFDIVCHSNVYKKINFFKRVALAFGCAKVIYRRFDVKKEIKGRYKGYIKTFF